VFLSERPREKKEWKWLYLARFGPIAILFGFSFLKSTQTKKIRNCVKFVKFCWYHFVKQGARIFLLQSHSITTTT
jgi:hypothetical protein